MVSTRTSLLKQEQNQLSPINNLPRELMVTIFSLSIDWSDFTPEAPRRLANVCHHWYYIVVASQIFWRHITVSGSEVGMLQTVLRKNVDGPLYVALSHPFGDRWMANVIKLKQQSHRWRRLHIRGSFAFTTNDFLAAAYPNLVELFVCRDEGVFPAPGTFRLSEGRHLESLGLKNVSPDWDSARLSRLRYIHVQDLVFGFTSANQFHMILVASPTLECLVLKNIVHVLTGPPPPSFPIPFPHLEAIILQDIPDELSVHLLTWLRAPLCKLLSVWGSAASTTRLFDLGKSFFRPGKAIKIQSPVQSGVLRVSSDPPPPDLQGEWFPQGSSFGEGMEFQLEVDDPMEINPFLGDFLACIQSFEEDQPCNIALELSGDPIMSHIFHSLPLLDSGHPWPSGIHQILPYISTFKCSSKIGVRLLKHLGEHATHSNGHREFPCPRLKRLTILSESWGNIVTMDPIVRVLRTLAEMRYGWVEELGMGSSRHFTAQPLKVVEIPGPIVYQVRRMKLFEGASIVPMW